MADDRLHLQSWLALMIGNSRLHWAWFVNSQLQDAWDTPHLSEQQVDALIAQALDFRQISLPLSAPLPPCLPPALPLWIASVVPAQAALWQAYPQVHCLTLADVPLKGGYSTLGIDRALALWGAICLYRSPVLVIDAGTALTLTGAAAEQLVGGAILPGLGLQLRSLTEHTAALPTPPIPQEPPSTRWATNTSAAIVSGVMHTLVAGLESFVEAWWQQYPHSPVILTGGDHLSLYTYWQRQHPNTTAQITVDTTLIFSGMAATRKIRIRK